jgi:hypothetical protein
MGSRENANSSMIPRCAGDGNRTRTPLSRQRILSPRRLPFRHPGKGDSFFGERRHSVDKFPASFRAMGRMFPVCFPKSTATRSR